jgi:hypothetical protein
MKLAIVSPLASNQIDGTIKHQLLDNLPNVVANQEQADAVIIPVSYFPDIEVNPRLYQIRKPVILVDYMEYGSSWNGEDTHIFGRNHHIAGCLQTPGWIHFSEWVKNNPPKLIFKRELLQKDACSTIKPISFLCHLERHPIQSREEYNARPLEVSFIWGFSHESRPRLHGAIFQAMATHGLGVISGWDQFHPHFEHNPPARNWATVHVPYYARHSMADVMWMNERSKIGVSCYGNGKVCFRTSEMRSTLMAMPEDNIAFPYQWVHGVNCLKFRNGHEFEDLEAFTRREDLYDIYVAGEANLDRYRPDRFIPEYFLPSIQSAL